MKWILGACTVSMTTGAKTTVVTFSEHWNGLDHNGRRYSPKAPHRHHAWRITETSSGFVEERQLDRRLPASMAMKRPIGDAVGDDPAGGVV